MRREPEPREDAAERSPRSSPSRALEGLRVLVTGASRGIGRAMALAFARDGARLVLHANRGIDEARELAQAMGRTGTPAVAIEADLAVPEGCLSLVERGFAAHGGLDAWINNAGADILSPAARALGFGERLDRLLRVDVTATMTLTRDAGRRMRLEGRGSIVNLGWDGALTGMEGDAGELFAAAKGAVASFTRSAALSLAPQVRVNCIACGWIQTEWGESAGPAWQERALRATPLGRWGRPEDVAELAIFLASARSGFITGQVIPVNGGAARP